STMYVPANERRSVTIRSTRTMSPTSTMSTSRVQPSGDLAHAGRGTRAEVHHFGFVDAIDPLVLARRRLGDARHRGKLVGGAESIEADVGRNDDVRRCFRDQL